MLGRHTRLGERAVDERVDAARRQLRDGEVRPRSRTRRAGCPPRRHARRLAARLAQTRTRRAPGSAPIDSATGMNCAGRDRAARRRVPAQERLDPDDGAGVECRSRAGSARLNSPRCSPRRSSCSRPSSSPSSRAIVGAEHLEAAAAALLRGVHREVGVADERRRRSRRPPGVHRDADARREHELAARRRSPGSASRSSTRRATSSAAASPAPSTQHRELVAAEARERVAGTRDVGQPAPDLHEQLVPDVVAEAVVDLLEAVEVEQEHGKRLARDRSERASACSSSVAEQRAVRQAREAVVERLPDELLLERDPLADVARVQHDAADVPVAAQVGARAPRDAATRRSGWRPGRRSRASSPCRHALPTAARSSGCTISSKPSPSSSSSERPSIRSTDPLT